MYLIDVIRCTQGYFTYTTPASIRVGGSAWGQTRNHLQVAAGLPTYVWSGSQRELDWHSDRTGYCMYWASFFSVLLCPKFVCGFNKATCLESGCKCAVCPVGILQTLGMEISF